MLETSRKAKVGFAADHPTAAGHFPGNPIIPGALLLDAVARAIATGEQVSAAPCIVNAAKFLHPVLPGETVAIEWSTGSNGNLHFSCVALPGGTSVLTGSLALGAAAC